MDSWLNKDKIDEIDDQTSILLSVLRDWEKEAFEFDENRGDPLIQACISYNMQLFLIGLKKVLQRMFDYGCEVITDKDLLHLLRKLGDMSDVDKINLQ